MRVQSIHLKNFKRFTDLCISNIPETAKLVVVVGPNGCGKSSLFDAFLHWYRYKMFSTWIGDDLYYRKDVQMNFDYREGVSVTLHGNVAPQTGGLYVRTAHRNDSDFSLSALNQQTEPTDSSRFNFRLTNDDKIVQENYQRLIFHSMAGIYNREHDYQSVPELREELIGQVRASMKCVFDDLVFNGIPSDDIASGSFFFQKGTVESYHYKNLSGGEKSAFDLLLDVHIKKKYFKNAIYCIDEIDTHLHTRVQGALLQEMAKVIPGDSQLWVTTHSLGVLRAAQKIEKSAPGSVCVIDFDDVNFDVPRELSPTALNKVAWEKMLSVALDDLSPQIAPKIVIVCEGSSVGTRRKNFDAEIYNQILGTNHYDLIFVSGGSSGEVGQMKNRLQDMLKSMLPETKFFHLVDRDDKSEKEVADCENNGGIVLSERNLESFLFADDVIKALVKREDKESLFENAKEIRSKALADSIDRGNPNDDFKSAAGEIFNGLKTLLLLQHSGNNVDAFMRYTLAPLIVPGMETYRNLEQAIVEKIRMKLGK